MITISLWLRIVRAGARQAKESSKSVEVTIAAKLSVLLISTASVLPAMAQEGTPAVVRPKVSTPIVGGVDTKDQAALSQTIDSLLNSTMSKKAAFFDSEKAVSKYKTRKYKTWSKLKDASNFLVPWHGFGPSSEAGDVILDEKVKLKSLDASEYARQTQIDATHLELMGRMLQLAKYAGSGNRVEADAARSGVEELTSPAEAKMLEESIQRLDTSCVTEAMQKYRTSLSAWQKRERRKQLADCFVKNDPVIIEVVKRIHRYNHLSGAARASGHVVETTLGLANLAPNILAPLSQGTLMSYEMANGGSEENKLIKELYLERRLQSRRQSLTELAEILVDSYEDALSEGNLQLAALAKSLMTEYGDTETTELVVNPQVKRVNLAEQRHDGCR